METCNTEIKIEVDDDDCEDNNNSEQITRLEQPLALIKRKERDITERFPYIEEVTTTTPSRYRSISKFMPSKRRALACKIYKCIKINILFLDVILKEMKMMFLKQMRILSPHLLIKVINSLYFIILMIHFIVLLM